jgi:hypothetical protein
MRVNWKIFKEPLRDAAIIYGLTVVGGFILGFSGIKVAPETMVFYNVMGMFMGILGFTIIGCTTKHNRVKYLPIVVLILWLITFSNVAMGVITSWNWVLSIYGMAIWMLLGGGLSYIFVRGTSASQSATQLEGS